MSEGQSELWASETGERWRWTCLAPDGRVGVSLEAEAGGWRLEAGDGWTQERAGSAPSQTGFRVWGAIDCQTGYTNHDACWCLPVIAMSPSMRACERANDMWAGPGTRRQDGMRWDGMG
jgi:hypothetical protein